MRRASVLAGLVLSFSLSSVAHAEVISCAPQFPGGQPPAVVDETLRSGTVMLCSHGYAVLESERTRGPLWAAEYLSEENLEVAGSTPRRSSFYPDGRLPLTMRAELYDYKSSGYDRGHMVPSGDEAGLSWQAETFALSNIVPQTAELNRGAWAGVESAVRGLADRDGELYVVTGPGYDPDDDQTIGPDHIPVPALTWKAIYDPVSNGTGVYVCLNTTTPQCRVISVALLTELVRIDPFPGVPATEKSRVMAMPPIGDSPYAIEHDASARGLLREWAAPKVQKALRSLMKAMRDG
ncbi:DNA/RNA non-specific endonuclease [Acetobacter estunensis]|uniref:Endonuclease n=1 Tax=Acetobacter estunensis TaxID=104097 RepID=A0A967ECV2_9PROT|nr:DNA/RNA non-specific endonuclease [Acetobacter estunensis]NHO55028.1 DNA/RNA non-specific endonuclease [Acetobacter estunensis]